MPADFPVPRSEIPRVEVSQEEYLARKLQMEGMVESIVQEYEEFSEVNRRHINMRRWKQVGSRERCKLYRERPKYQTSVGALGSYSTNRKYSHATSTSSGHSNTSWNDDVMSEDSYAGPSSSSCSSVDSHGSRKGKYGVARSRRTSSSTSSISMNGGKLDPQTNAAVIADAMPKMLMIGERPGRLEDAMHSLVARNHEELAFVVVFLHKDVADCAILNTMEAPTDDEPYRYLGYKWFVKPSPATAISNIIKNRDSLYIEYTGVTATSTGEVVGYHIMHSIDIDGFPDFHDRNAVRASQSMCSLYYQKEENMVEFFMMGNVEIGGMVGQSPFRKIFISDAMFGMPRSIDAGEAKRLTQLVVDRRRARAASGRTRLAPLCRLCRSEKKSYNRVSLVLCEICGHTVCSRCRVYKEVFESDGLLGRFNKFDCCKTCVVDISNTHLPTAKPHAVRPRLPSHQGANGQARGRNWTATSATVYEDEEEEAHDDLPTPRVLRQHREHRDHRGKLSVASASTASTDMSSSRTMQFNDMSFDSRNSTVSDISEFDQSFAIIRNTAQREDFANRDTCSRETAFSIDDLEDDWQPDFAKSQINRFSKPQMHDNLAASQNNHKHDMVLYTKGAAGHHHHTNHRNMNGGGGGGMNHHRNGGGFDNQYMLTHGEHAAAANHHHHHHQQQQQQQQHYHDYERQMTPLHPRVHNSAPSAGPPNLQRNHSNSSGSDYSRDDLINRMQHLAQLAEATYNTTCDTENRFNGAQSMKKAPPVENRNRFFYY